MNAMNESRIARVLRVKQEQADELRKLIEIEENAGRINPDLYQKLRWVDGTIESLSREAERG